MTNCDVRLTRQVMAMGQNLKTFFSSQELKQNVYLKQPRINIPSAEGSYCSDIRLTKGATIRAYK